MKSILVASLALVLCLGALTPVMAKPVAPHADPAYVVGANYRLILGEGATSDSFTYPTNGNEHMYWWEWGLFYQGTIHLASDFNTLAFAPQNVNTKFTLWMGSNGAYLVTVLIFANEPNRVDFWFFFKALKSVGPVTFYQGADFDIDGSSGGDYGVYSSTSDTAYGIGNAGTYIGLRALNAHSTSHETNYYGTMWDDLYAGNLTGQSSYGPGDMSDALGFNVPTTGALQLRLGVGSSLSQFSAAMGVTVSVPG